MDEIKKIKLTYGSRLRRISQDGRSFLDKGMIEGVIIEHDMLVTLIATVHDKNSNKTAHIVDVEDSEGNLHRGWVYSYESVV